MKTRLTPWLVAGAVALITLWHAPARAQLGSLIVENPIRDDLLPPARGSLPAGREELVPAPVPEPEPLAVDVNANPEPETVRERYPNRRVKVQRQVVQDAQQNYINHGKWKLWDEQGDVLMEGEYKYNERHGVWTRIYRDRQAKLFTIAPFNQGQLPIVSQADFKDGKLDGSWVIYDANKRKLCEWRFTDGRRDGVSTWWYVGGGKMREISYVDGSIDGELNEWDQAGKQVTQDQYDDGRRLAKQVEYYPDRSKKSESTILYPRLVLDAPDDWEQCRLATYSQEGEPEKHGAWTSWYANGQRRLEGHYEHDQPSGEFTWWHPNGQKALAAGYLAGKKDGNWTWWHENGQKSIQGMYANDEPSSKWLWWQESGQVAQRADFSDPDDKQILARPPQKDSPDNSPSAILPPANRVLR